MLLSASRKSLCLPNLCAFQCVNDSVFMMTCIYAWADHKPGSVWLTVIYLGLSSRRASRDHTRRSAGRLQPSLLDLASYGACIAHELLHAWWAFTLHLFTIAAKFLHDCIFSAALSLRLLRPDVIRHTAL